MMRPNGYESPKTPAAMSPPNRSVLLGRSPSPRAHMGQLSTPPRLPSITAQQPFDFDDPSHSHTTVFGFSPPRSQPPLLPSSSPITSHFFLPKAGAAVPILSPSLGAGEHGLQGPLLPGLEPSSPRFTDSPYVLAGEFPPRSRRNSAAVVSISLSSRSRSRTPHGRKATLPAEHSGSGTPSKAATPRVNPGEDWAPGAPGLDSMDGGDEDWRAPTGGIMLDADESADHFSLPDDDDDDDHGRSWTAESEVGVTDVLRPGAIFGEGLEFEGDIIKPATGRLDIAGSNDAGVPLRRDGSKIGVPRKQTSTSKRSYEVIRRLGSGSYAVVYLVREQGGRKREFALKCLSKHDLEEEQLETQLFEATIHLSLPIHPNIVTLHETLQTKNWLFLMLELCPGEDLFYWLERSRDASPPPAHSRLMGGQHLDNGMDIMSSSRLSSSTIPFSSSQLFSGFGNSYNSPNAFSPAAGFGSQFSGSPASLLFAHHNGMAQSIGSSHAATPPTPSLLSSFSANTLLTSRRLRLIASMFSQMCEAVAVCHDAGVSHRDIKPENFICCDSVELETVAEGDDKPDFGPQAKRKVVVKLTDFGLATTDEDSGDVECGSKPYMAYECRNNLGPSYRPAPADVWSLGIVLINMLFHRNPWKDPIEGDPNFDAYYDDPVGFLQTKFTGIGKEVATYIAEHVLCIEVEDRVSARELGQWIRNLPEMIGGRRAIHRLKMDRLESRSKAVATDKGLFVKSPIMAEPKQKSALASALASSALASSAPISVPRPPPTGPLPPPPVMPFNQPIPAAVPQSIAATIQEVPSLSSLPPHQELVEQPGPTPELEPDEIRSATTVDDNPTPTDMSTVVSPEPTEGGDEDADLGDLDNNDGSGANQKRRKRGVRKGKAAQAALAAAKEDPEDKTRRDALLAELVTASQDLARDLSKKKPFDPTRIEDFPPLGMDPREAAAGRKSKWKDFLAASKGNPQLEALARRVAERDDGGWSAPAKLQQSKDKDVLSRPSINRQTATTTSSVVSANTATSSAANTATSSATSSSGGGPEDDDWRRRARERERRDKDKGMDSRPSTSSSRRGTTEDSSRHRQATIAAAALANGLDPMGSFGRPSHLRNHSVNRGGSPLAGPPRHPRLERDNADRNDGRWAPSTSSIPMPLGGRKDDKVKHVTHEVRDRTDRPWRETRPRGEFNPTKSAPAPMAESNWATSSFTPPASTAAFGGSNASTPTPTAAKPTFPSQSSATSLTTINGNATANGAAVSPEMPNKPKLKGQISTLSNMLSRLKTKGRD
ncbi:kinase-like protein [Cutaneotrichosporon oleaginosum]|uniref:Kinase-like protein n=1 Tax=Cutaneotrichosporon oleaginosum TaxID=879819 RepID=A0A0J0XLB1_9TREE|nr:kinase-like protein [Cutaneotrichosporon oleaginosum]KLT41882.1 kinase-like protein [Cutaneotrichosporon oleaginosum]